MKSQPTHDHRLSLTRQGIALIAAFAIGLAVTACLSPPKPRAVIHEDLRGSVYLEAMPDGAVPASHPISLEPAVIARILRGIQVQERQRVLQTLVAGAPTPVRAFSDEDTTFLARHIVTALSRSTAQQLVRFRVLHSTASGTETTGGELFAHGHTLHASLTHYRYNPEKPGSDSKPGRQLPDPTGLAQRRVLFFPESSQGPAVEGPATFLGSNPHVTVVVDYEALARIPESPHTPTTSLPQSNKQIPKPEQVRAPDSKDELPSATSEELQSMRALIEKQAKELEALKDEVEILRRHQTEAQTTPPKSKAKKQPAPRPRDTTP